MTLIRVYEILSKTKNGKNRNKEIIEVLCDNCQLIFNYKGKKSRGKNSKLHFCSKECSSISFCNGKLREATIKTQIEKYGSIYVETNEFAKKQKSTFLNNYGVKSVMSSPEIRKKIEKVFQKKYGRRSFTGTDEHKSKCDFKQIAQKAWLTKIKNGTCSKSGSEEKLNIILINEFGISNIKRQVSMTRQWIDFYITSLDLYVQVDGVYWHGLNRDIEIIKKGTTSQDIKIYKQILRDEKLNGFMKENKMKLIRITDEQLDNKSPEEIINILKGAV